MLFKRVIIIYAYKFFFRKSLIYLYRQTGEDLSVTHEFGVLTGALDINLLSAPGVVYHTIETVYKNSNYSFGNKLFDIALIKVTDPIKFDDTARIICLASDGPEPYQKLVITGWGTSTDPSDVPYSPILRKADIATECISFCEVANTLPVVFDAATQFCASQNMMGFCNGDTGGPAFSLNGTVYTQYGIISHQKGCGFEENEPGFYTKVASFKEWIQNTIGKCLSC